MNSANSKKNIKKTYLIILLVILITALLVYFICRPFTSIYTSIIIALTFSICCTFLYYICSNKIILNLSKAQKTTKEEYAKLDDILKELCSTANIPKPKIYITNEEQANAFVIGKSPKSSVICVTTGLLEKMDHSELKSIIAHEICHIKNYDSFISTMLTVTIGMPIILSDIFSRYMAKKHSKKEQKDGSFTILISLLLSILSPISAKIIEILLPKNRYYIADICAIRLTKDYQSLINALKKVYSDTSILNLTNLSIIHLYIANPIKTVNSKDSKDLFTAHPSIEKRIKNIEAKIEQ